MLLRMLSLILVSLGLFGCLPTYIVSNELSNKYDESRYNESRAFFSEDYSSLKDNDVLFYIYTGYYHKKEKKLIVFLEYDFLDEVDTFLTRADLLANDQLFTSASTGDSYSETPTKFDDYVLYHGSARLAFDVQDIDDLLGNDLSIEMGFRYREIDSSIRIDIDIDLMFLMPTT